MLYLFAFIYCCVDLYNLSNELYLLFSVSVSKSAYLVYINAYTITTPVFIVMFARDILASCDVILELFTFVFLFKFITDGFIPIISLRNDPTAKSNLDLLFSFFLNS